MKKFQISLILLIITGMLFALDGPAVYQKMQDRDSSKSMHSIIKMSLIDASGETKERVIETWTMIYDEDNDLSQSVMEFKSPASVKGTRFLQIQQDGRGDDQWIFLPTLGQVRRIVASESNSSFMGSDFTYDDMQLQGDDNSEHVLLREEKVGDYDCYVLESKSQDNDGSYAKLVSWVTKEHFLPVKVEFYNKSTGELQKVMTIEGKIEKINGIDTAFITRMKNMKDNHQTVIEVMRNKEGAPFVEYNTKINPARFTQNYLQSGK